jgi:hypothetical protein
MFVIAPIASMNFLPIMKIAMRAPPLRGQFRSSMRNGAGKRRCADLRRYSCAGKRKLKSGGYRARPDLP